MVLSIVNIHIIYNSKYQFPFYGLVTNSTMGIRLNIRFRTALKSEFDYEWSQHISNLTRNLDACKQRHINPAWTVGIRGSIRFRAALRSDIGYDWSARI